MAIDKISGGVLDLNLNRILDNISELALGVVYTDIAPTNTTVPWGKFVIYDNGTASTRELWIRTAKDTIQRLFMMGGSSGDNAHGLLTG
ncbi:hypothetical protein LCGC14_2588910, partial [marine sediment metagenome]